MRTLQGRLLALAGLATIGLVACGESIESDNVDTAGIYADFWATAEGDGNTLVHAGLKTGGPNSNTFLTLQDGDELTFYAGEDSYTPNSKSVFGQYEVYEKDVPEDSGATRIRIEFTRADGANAPNSSVTLPKKFQITNPSSGATFSRSSDDISVELNNGDNDATMTLDVHGECLENGYNTHFTGTQVTIPHGELETSQDEEDPETCDAGITIIREVDGEVDPAYDSGEFEGVQERTLSFTSEP